MKTTSYNMDKPVDHQENGVGSRTITLLKPKVENGEKKGHPVNPHKGSGDRIRSIDGKPINSGSTFRARETKESSKNAYSKQNNGKPKNQGGYSKSTRTFTSSERLHRDRPVPSASSSSERRESFLHTIVDLQLSKLLRNIAKEDEKEAKFKNAEALKQFLEDAKNLRTLQKAGVNLYEVLLELTKEQRTPMQVKHLLIECIAKTGLYLGSQSSYGSRLPEWLFSTFNVENDEVKIYLMDAFLVFLRARPAQATMQQLLNHVVDALENEVSGKVLESILEVILFFAENCQTLFATAFKDVVDIMIGWHLDLEVTDEIVACLTKAMLQFHSYWSSHMILYHSLTSNLLEDMEQFTNESVPLKDAELEEKHKKTGLLLRVFLTLVNSCGKSAAIQEGHLSRCLKRILACMQIWSNKRRDEHLVPIVNQCVQVLIANGAVVKEGVGLQQFLKSQLKNISSYSYSSQISFVHTFATVLLHSDASQVSELVEHVLQDDLLTLKLSHNCKVVEATLYLYHYMFSLKDMQLLQSVFRQVMRHVGAALRIISDQVFDQVTDLTCIIGGVQYNKEIAELSLLFHLSTLAEVAKDTSNLILMYAFEPSIFDFLLQNCLIGHGEQVKKNSVTVQALLKMLYLHCSSHNNYISKSSLFAGETLRPALHGITVSYSGKDYFVQLLESMPHLLSITASLPVSLSLVVGWCKEIFVKMAEYNLAALSHPLITRIMDVLLGIGADRCAMESLQMDICCIIVTMAQSHVATDAMISRLADYCVYHLANDLPSVSDSYRKALLLFPISELLSMSRKANNPSCLCRVRAIRRRIMNGEYGSLTTECFRTLASSLFKIGTRSSDTSTDSFSLALLAAENASHSSEEIVHHVGTLQFWVLWQMAEFCIANRLRTPIGKPQDTFICIETTIKQLAMDCRSVEEAAKTNAEPRLISMILLFMENLEKLLYNAYEGSTAPIVTHTKLVRTFFRTNRSTCLEWLTRIRLQILTLASAYGQQTSVVRYGYELLLDMYKSNSMQTPEFELVCVYLSEAWVQLKCPEALQGLYDWSRKVCSRKLHWVKALAAKASQKYEPAMVDLLSCLRIICNPPADITGDTVKLQTRPADPSSALTQFCTQQITDCYASLQSWTEASDWLVSFESMKEEHPCLAGVDPVSEHVKALGSFETTSTYQPLSWSRKEHINLLWHDSLIPSASAGLIDSRIHSLNKLLLLDVTAECPAAVQPDTLLALIASECSSLKERQWDIFDSTSRSSVDLSWMLKAVTLLQKANVSEELRGNAMLSCCCLARRTENFKLARKLTADLKDKCAELRLVNGMASLALKVEMEDAKQLYLGGDVEKALCVLSSVSQNQGDRELAARANLTIVKWLQSDSKLLLLISESLRTMPAGCSVHSLEAYLSSLNPLPTSAVVPEPEQLLGTVLKATTDQCPGLAKTWFTLAGWFYKWGRKCLDAAGQAEMSSEELKAIDSLLPAGTSASVKEAICAVMTTIEGGFNTEEDLSDETEDYGTGLQEVRRRLSACCTALDDNTLDALVDMWASSAKRLYFLYEQSASAYFSYLKLSSGGKGSEDNNVTATLRILRLLVKHAWELRNVLESGLSSSPTSPWKSIIPQLFSRLSHPEAYVRQSVAELLCRVAVDAPHLIVYPAIVGCSNLTAPAALPYMEGEDIDQEVEDEPSSTQGVELQNCFQALVDTLSRCNPQMIQEVQTFVRELCRITVLWDELWLGSLSQLQATVSEKIKQLASEVDRVRKNASLTPAEQSLLIQEKRTTIARPLIHTLERLSEITSQPAETDHEKSFQKQYASKIATGLCQLKHPGNDEDLQSGWLPFKQLYSELQQKSQKRTSHVLKMKDISEILANLSDTGIPLPGLSSQDGAPVTLQSVMPQIFILPTKTKPKKLVFQGSDGVKYTYLFKGLEDLHLDERIMQFLTIINDMLLIKGANASERPMYRARNYSVTPLGLRSGLIQWVDGCLPLFSLYKRWQVREAAAQNRPHTTASTTARPSEVFFNKLIPLIKPLLDDRGIRDVKEAEKIRKDWPASALLAAVKQLIAETPSQLVARELWCHCTDANEWWQVTQTYCRSVAVMSSIGYILGLGDRHLDNLLLDLNNGEVVHIDYNVCFDKGKSLRVPECVPFRLTQNIVAGMGACGVEGLFRSACEHTIKTMRSGRETLLTLLEAFVYDPLVDWTVGGETGLAAAFYGGNYAIGSASKEYRKRKRQMERDITRSMFSIRVTEMKVAWMQNKEDLRCSLNELVKKLTSISDDLSKVQLYTEQLQQCEQLGTFITEAKQNGGQTVNQLLERYSAHQQLLAEKQTCQQLLHDFLTECTKYHKLHQSALEDITSPVLTKLTNDVGSLSRPIKPASSCTATFLQSVGQTAQLSQCEQIEGQLGALMQKRVTVLTQCIESLRQYSSVANQFSPRYCHENIMAYCMQFASRLLQDLSHNNCVHIEQEMLSSNKSNPSASLIVKALANERGLEASLTSDIARLAKLSERADAEDQQLDILVSLCEDRRTLITQFREKYGEVSHQSLLGVLLPKLVEMCRRYQIMESAASGAGERLVDLMSRDGDWFLDELASVTENLFELLNLVKLHPHSEEKDTDFHLICHQIIQRVGMIYVSLQDVIEKFTTVILPKVTSYLLKQEGSFMIIVTTLKNEVLKDTNLKDLCGKLEISLRNVIFGTKEPDREVVRSAEALRASFLLLVGDDSEHMTAGLQLMKAFDGLFSRVLADYEAAVKLLSQVNPPKAWRKVDVMREASSLQQSAYSERTEQLLSLIFFVKQMQAMNDFFSLSEVRLQSFTDPENGGPLDSYDTLTRPMKTFIADFVRRQLLGVASQCLGFLICDCLQQLGLDVDKEIALKDFGASSKVAIDDLLKKAVDQRTRTVHGTRQAQAGSLVAHLETAWRRQDLAKRMQRNRNILDSMVKQQRVLLICYQWLHESLIVSGGQGSVTLLQPTRKDVLTELSKGVQALSYLTVPYEELTEKLSTAEQSIIQRLRWAAGANPTLSTTLAMFESSQQSRHGMVQAETKLVRDITMYCNAILHMETLRTKSQEAANLEIKFKDLLAKCTQVCASLKNNEQITDSQLLMLSLMSKTDRQKTGSAFMARASEVIHNHQQTMASKIRGLNKLIAQHIDKYQAHAAAIQYGVLNAHHKLISEVRAVLKTLAKEEAESVDQSNTGIQDYLKFYKSFSEKLSALLKKASPEKVTQGMELVIAPLVDSINQDIECVFDRLIELARPLTAAVEQSSTSEQNVSSPTSKEFGLELPVAGTAPFKDTKAIVNKPDKVARDPKTGKAVQERNSYAVSVWRRVKMKLDGRELDPNKKLSVSDQVEYIISEATDVENLARMYEGWTSWV